jgi:gliding motility-associated protein GldM
MSLPKEPRQKMINIMYLVLTALLALNVSSEILNAFKTVDNSLKKTNTTVNASTDQIFNSLTEKMSDPATAVKASTWQPKAKEAIGYSKEAFDFIQQLKNDILKEAGGDPNDPTKTFKEDNLEIATRIMVKEGKGKQLLAMLEKFKTNISHIDDSSAAYKELLKSLQVDTEKPKTATNAKKSWEETYFHMVPTVAALTILTKFQNDIKTSENKVVAYCHEQVGKVVLKFDSFEAIVGQNSNYFMPGQELVITAGLGAYSKTKLPNVSVNGQGVALNEKGQAVYKTQAGGAGPHKVDVTVSFTDQDGTPQTRTIPVEYFVGSPSGASVALDEMNVLYVGWPNKVTVAAGTGDEKVNVSMSGAGSISKVGPGKYIATVNTPGQEVQISVTADGKPVGSFPFRVRRIPDPVATIGGVMSGDNMTAGQIRGQGGVGAFIKDFPLDIKYSVTSFTLSADNDEGTIDEAPCQGNTWSPKALGILRGLVGGRTVTVDNIRAVGPDGQSRKIPSLVYYIK